MNILIAEDDATSRYAIARFLESRGCQIFEAADGDAAHSSIMENQIDIAVLDWMMPGMSGIDVCRSVRQQRTDYVYIIILTARDGESDVLEGFEAGADEYVKKPVNLPELAARIRVGERIIGLERSLRRQQHELSEINQMKNKFIGIVAHDLKNPVISIRGFSELMLKEPANLNEDQKEFLGIIHSTSRNMLAMINDLLDISLIDSGKWEIVKKPSLLKKLVEERILPNRLQAAQKQITMYYQLADVPRLSVDPQRVGQAVDNLISNAIKYSPYGAKIHMVLKQEDDRITFSVQDEGSGIPEAEQPLLFREFHRLSIRPTGGETSTGLGLSITKKIMEAHGGSIEVESHEQKGSTFTLIFPVAPAPSDSRDSSGGS